MEEENETDKQPKSTNGIKPTRGSHLQPWHFKKGVSGNPNGRQKGAISLKEYARKYLQEMTDEDKLDFMQGLNKDTVWKMAEGNPHSTNDNKTELIVPKPILDVIHRDNSNTQS